MPFAIVYSVAMTPIYVVLLTDLDLIPSTTQREHNSAHIKQDRPTAM